MNINTQLKSTATQYDYLGTNSKGHGVRINADGNGVSPMENLLLSVAACSCVDIEMLLVKMRNNLTSLTVDVKGERVEDVVPKPFTAIHLHYKLYGEVKEKSATKVVAMSVEKYCSVSACLDPDIKVTHSFEILP